MKPAALQPETGASAWLFDKWVESDRQWVRERVREFIEGPIGSSAMSSAPLPAYDAWHRCRVVREALLCATEVAQTDQDQPTVRGHIGTVRPVGAFGFATQR